MERFERRSHGTHFSLVPDETRAPKGREGPTLRHEQEEVLHSGSGTAADAMAWPPIRFPFPLPPRENARLCWLEFHPNNRCLSQIPPGNVEVVNCNKVWSGPPPQARLLLLASVERVSCNEASSASRDSGPLATWTLFRGLLTDAIMWESKRH